LTADGESGVPGGNYTITITPAGVCLINLPGPLRYLANSPRGRYRLDATVAFPHRGTEWVQRVAAEQAVRYDVTYHPGKDRWYLDASWKVQPPPVPPLEALRVRRTFGLDLNEGHLAGYVLDEHGNPEGPPRTIPLELAGLPASTRDGRLHAAISQIIVLAAEHDCPVIGVEDLNFADARKVGRETMGALGT